MGRYKLTALLVIAASVMAFGQGPAGSGSARKVHGANNQVVVQGDQSSSGTCDLKVNTSNQWEVSCPLVTSSGGGAANGIDIGAQNVGCITFEGATADAFETKICPTDPTADRAVTFPDSDTKIPIATQFVTIAGPTAPRTYTMPDANASIFSDQSKADVLQAAQFCSDAGANDAYNCSLSPAITAYTTGVAYRFKANTANTGVATINLNSLGAKTIKKKTSGVTTDLDDNDIRAGAWVTVVYDGTNMQCVGGCDGNAATGGTGYATVKDEGTPVTQRTSVNFIGAGVTCADNAGTSTTDCTISGGGGGSQVYAVATKTAAYSITSGDFSAGATIAYTGTTAGIDFTLPTSGTTNGQTVFVKNASNVSIFLYQGGASGQQIDGQKAPVLITAGEGLVVHSDGTNFWTESRGNARRYPNRRIGIASVKDQGPSAAGYGYIGGINFVAASGCVNVINTSTDGFRIKCDSGTAANGNSEMNTIAASNSGLIYVGAAAMNFRFSARYAFDDGTGGVTNTRAFVGVMDGATSVAAAGAPLQTDTPTVKFIGFRCSQTAGTPDTNWMAYWGDGTAGTPTSTGIACNNGTAHTFEIQEHGGNTAYFFIDGAVTNCVGADAGCTSAAAHYPSGSMFSVTGVETTTSSARRYSYLYWIQEETDR